MADAKHNKLAFVFIMITLLIDSIGIGIIIPVMPDLIQDVEGGDLGNAALWGGLLVTSFALMQFLFGPALGGLSDRFGRRPVLLVSLLVMAIDYVVMGFANTIWLLFIARIVAGIAAATQTTAAAFIADVSSAEEKSQNFGLMGAAFGLGFVIGPMIGGILGEYDPRAPFFAAAAVAGVNLIFGYFVLPETVTDAIRRPFEIKRANPFGAFMAIRKLPNITKLLTVEFFYEFAFLVFPTTWAYFTLERFGWSPLLVGVSLMSFGISIALVQGLLIRWIIPKLGEPNTILLGLGFNLIGFVFLVFNTSGLAALLFTPIIALGAVANPAIIGLMSQTVSDKEQGELQGLIASTRSVAAIFSPLVMTQLFFVFTRPENNYVPGAAFALSAGLMIICIAILQIGPKVRHT